MSNTPAILAEGLQKHYGKTQALVGLDLVAEQGSVLGLLGPNGAGKTTAVRILTTLLRPDAGRAEVIGLDVVKHADALRARIGLAGQYAAVDENLTGYENLEMFGRLYHLSGGVARRRANELLARFDLVDAARRTVKTYSGGMRRRLDLAASLIISPPVLFLDEPTTGLDLRGRLGMWEVISTLVADGTTVLLTTQYLEEADQLADQIAVVDYGRVIANGTADELKAQVGGERLELTVTRGGDLDAAVQALRPYSSGELQVDADRRHLVVPVTRGAQQLAEVVRDLDAEQIPLDDLALRRPTLDDVFLALEYPMNSSAFRTAEILKPQARPPLYWTFADALVLARRHLIQIPRIPEELIFATIQPIMFVLLFRYVFGGAIAVSGTTYVNFLMAGIFVQTVIFGSTTTGIGLATDLQRGLVDRFRSLPMAKSAVLTGRTLADLIRNTFVVIVMWIVGLLVGFQPQGNVLFWLAAVGILLLTSFAFSWISATIGLAVRSVEAAQSAGFIWLFPLTFASSAFVPTQSMPTWLRTFAEHQPVTLIINAVRGLLLNHPDASTIWQAIAWCVGILVVFIPLAVWAYGRRTAR